MMQWKRFLALFLALLMVFPTVVLAKPAEAEGDYVRYKTLSATDLLILLSGSSPSEEEKAYLEQYYGEETVYNAAIPGGLIAIAGGSATAMGYTTKTTQDRTITWTPQGSVILNGGIAQATYRGALTVPRTEANRLLNYVYQRAMEAAVAESEITAYEEYQEYLVLKAEYDRAKREYDNYVVKKKAYDLTYARYIKNKEAWDAYNAYMEAKTKYDNDLAVYNAAKAVYDQKLAEYNAAVSAHDAYEKNKVKIDIALLPIESMFIDYGMWNGSKYGLDDEIGVRSLYEALQNEDLVAMLMQYQSKICSATSLTKAEFDKLKKTSDDLNALLRQYAEKRESSPKDAFAFYKANYTSIRDKFNHLYDEMTVILKPSVYTLMCAAIDEEYGNLAPYKKWRIKNVLCQIYVVSQCMDDTSTKTARWSFYADDGDPHEFLYSDLINQSQILSDSNAANPSTLSWQTEPVIPEKPVEPVAPKAPTPKVNKPTTTVAKPTEPTPVPEPTPIAEVPEAEEPSEASYETVRRCATILAAWKLGKISRRTTFSADATVYLHETVSRRYDPATGNPIESVYDENGALSEESLVAKQWKDGARTYVLKGFKADADGLCFYPIYDVEGNVFEIIFRSEEKELERRKLSYGEMAKPTKTPTKASTNTHTYTFDGWTPTLAVVKGNATYDAKFTEHERLYTVTFKIREEQLDGVKETVLIQKCKWNAVLTVPETVEDYIEGIYWYTFSGWDREIVPVNGDVVYTALYEKIPLIDEPEITEPEATEPEATEPEATEPEVTEPEVTEPEATEPEVTEPEVTEPKVTEPKETEPKVTEPEATEPEETETEIESESKESETETETESESESDEEYLMSDGLSYKKLSDGTWEVSGIGSCKDVSVVIPPLYEGIAVTRIGENAFRGQTEVREIALPDTITHIGASAFYGCTRLTIVEIPKSVISIGTMAFGGCTGLIATIVAEENSKYHSTGNCLIETASKTLILGYKGTQIPDDGSVTSIGAYAFYGCDGIIKLTVPKWITAIGEGAFEGCNRLSEIYYQGTARDWEQISIGTGNEKLLAATRIDQPALEPEDTEPEVTEPEVTEPEVTEPEATEPEMTEPEVSDPEMTESEETEPEVTLPEGTEPEITESEATRPEGTEPEMTEPETTEPEVTDFEETEPEVTLPEGTEPEITEPVETDPMDSQPEETEPKDTEPMESEPEMTEPEESESETTLGSDNIETDRETDTEAGGEETAPSVPQAPSISIEPDGIFVKYYENTLSCGNLIFLANVKKKPLSVDFGKEQIQLEADYEAVQDFSRKNVDQIKLLTSEETNGRGVGLAFYDKNGMRVYPDGYMKLTIPAEAVTEGRICLRRYLSDGSYEDLGDVALLDGVFEFEADSSSTYGTVRFYTVTVKVGDKETRYEAEAGSWIPLTLTPPLRYRIDPLHLVMSGQTEGVLLERTDGFTMPDYDGTITVTFSEILYRVEFRYRGGSFVKEYRYGDKIEEPKIPLSVTEDGICYTFIGWNNPVDPTVIEDKVYEALYETLSEEEAADKGDKGAMKGVFRYWVLPLGGIALGVIAVMTGGIILTVKLVKKRKKKQEKE